jgi:hypothetical protein
MANQSADFAEIGCRQCGQGGFSWTFWTDGKGNFRAVHKCGHESRFQVVNKPDPQAIDLRMLT